MISLRDAHARRQRIDEQLGRLNLAYRLSEAFAGESGLEMFNGFDESSFLRITCRRHTPGEIGCFASHRRLWQLSADSGQPIVVLEDDGAIEPHFPTAVNYARSLINSFGFIRLQNDFAGRRKKKLPVGRAGPFTLSLYRSYPFGAMAYALSPTASIALLEASKVLMAPVDHFIKRYWEHGLSLYGLLPFSVTWEDLAHQSTIRDRSRAGSGRRTRWEHRFSKAQGWLERQRFNRIHRPGV